MATKFPKRLLALLVLVVVASVFGKFHCPPWFGFWDGPVGG